MGSKFSPLAMEAVPWRHTKLEIDALLGCQVEAILQFVHLGTGCLLRLTEVGVLFSVGNYDSRSKDRWCQLGVRIGWLIGRYCRVWVLDGMDRASSQVLSLLSEVIKTRLVCLQHIDS